MRHVGLKERRDVETRSERERLKQSQREREREGETEKQPLGVYFSLRVPQTANTLQWNKQKYFAQAHIFARLTFYTQQKWIKNNVAGSQSQPSHHTRDWQKPEIILLVFPYRKELWHMSRGCYKNITLGLYHRVEIQNIYMKEFNNSDTISSYKNTMVVLHIIKHHKISWNSLLRNTNTPWIPKGVFKKNVHCSAPKQCVGLFWAVKGSVSPVAPGFMNL